MNAPSASAAALVRRGFDAQQSGDLAAAEAAYGQALQIQPGQPDALQLLGLLARRRGDLAQAESLMRASLASREAQPHVWNNLGNVLAAAGRSDEAETCHARALALQPGYADALYNLARLQHRRGLPAAEALLAQAMAQPAGPSVAMLQLQAQIEGDSGRTAQALATLEQALAAAPQRAALYHNRAVLLQRLQRPAEALAAHERALAMGEDAADAHYNLGNVLQSLGRAAQAARAYRAALAREPRHALAHFDLARLRWRQGEPDFDSELAVMLQRRPDAALALLHGQLLWRAERPAAAARAYAQGLADAAAEAPHRAALHDGLARCEVRAGAVENGLAEHRRALALAPGQAELHTHHAASLLVARRPAEAAAAAATACALAPEDQQAWAVQGLAWRALGDPRAAWLDDGQAFVGCYELAPPAGWADMDGFNAALAAELTALHAVDREAPVDQTLRHGTQTLGNLFDQGHPLVDALKARIAEAVDAYVAALPADPGHPLLRRRSSGWRFTDSWSSRLRRQGFHTDHVHPHGWISSCYYVALPPAVDDPRRRAGWLRFGVPDFDAGLPEPVALRQVKPRPGRLLLFPSLSWHGTLPFNDDTPRLTIAFDVVPR